jgi:hypothetical protein
MPIEKIFTVAIENKPGTLAAVARTVADAGVNINGICQSTEANVGLVRLWTNDANKTRDALKKAAYPAFESEALVVQAQNQPGELAAKAKTLADAGVNIEHAWAVGQETGQKVALVFQVNDVKKAAQALK